MDRQDSMTCNNWEPVLVLFTIAILVLAAGTLPPAATAQKTDTSIPKAQRALALGQEDVKGLLLLMDTDKNGKVSKQEFMSFMEAEFDRLDKDKSGELDPKELTQSQIRVYRPATGK
jgi:EF hand